MHGNNEPRSSESFKGTYQVHEVFHTIQGEGPFAGLPAVFVRLTGCHYRCHFCDTVWDDAKDPQLTTEGLVKLIKISSSKCKLVVITGGEPCRQDLAPILQELLSDGYKVQVETAGTFWQDCLQWDGVTIVCSPKTSKVHREILDCCNHWKYVVRAGDASEEDGLPVEGTQKDPNGGPHRGSAMARPPKTRKANVYLQPCDEYDESRNKANMKHMVDISMKYGYRAGLQLHKYFNVP